MQQLDSPIAPQQSFAAQQVALYLYPRATSSDIQQAARYGMQYARSRYRWRQVRDREHARDSMLRILAEHDMN